MLEQETTVLFRPVGQKELELIRDSGWTAFPPRLSWQPIFYPVLNEEYASFIAREWNTEDEASGFIGHVLRFQVASTFLEGYTVQKVGSATALEYWIPAEDLVAFNQHIVGKIELTATYLRGPASG